MLRIERRVTSIVVTDTNQMPCIVSVQDLSYVHIPERFESLEESNGVFDDDATTGFRIVPKPSAKPNPIGYHGGKRTRFYPLFPGHGLRE
jgi:hypothetical protein